MQGRQDVKLPSGVCVVGVVGVRGVVVRCFPVAALALRLGEGSFLYSGKNLQICRMFLLYLQSKERKMYIRIRNVCGLLGVVLPWLALFSAGLTHHPRPEWWWSIRIIGTGPSTLKSEPMYLSL